MFICPDWEGVPGIGLHNEMGRRNSQSWKSGQRTRLSWVCYTFVGFGVVLRSGRGSDTHFKAEKNFPPEAEFPIIDFVWATRAKAAPPGTSCSADASEARIVHGRPGRPPSSEAGLTFRTDRPRAEDPGRSGRSELSGSGSAHSGPGEGPP